jgi:PIN domain nuclease of toxin-antitoxin system
MKLLLDTQIFLWWSVAAAELSAAARAAIAAPANQAFLSAASAWEMAVKARRRGSVLSPHLAAMIEQHGFRALDISMAHAAAAAALPPHHRDPFDRILVAQAQLEGLTLVSHDRRLAPYDVAVLWS